MNRPWNEIKRKICQLKHDNSLPPEYWDWEGDYIGEEDEPDKDGENNET